MEIEHGLMFPKEGIEGSSVTVTCDKGFKVEGDWQLRCYNGTLNNDSTVVFPKCVPIHKGKMPIFYKNFHRM